MTNKIKFTREFNPAYLGAEGWGSAAKGYAENPYFALYEGPEGVFDIIIDANGISLYNTDGDSYYSSDEVISARTAAVLANEIENKIDADLFVAEFKADYELVELYSD